MGLAGGGVARVGLAGVELARLRVVRRGAQPASTSGNRSMANMQARGKVNITFPPVSVSVWNGWVRFAPDAWEAYA